MKPKSVRSAVHAFTDNISDKGLVGITSVVMVTAVVMFAAGIQHIEKPNPLTSKASLDTTETFDATTAFVKTRELSTIPSGDTVSVNIAGTICGSANVNVCTGVAGAQVLANGITAKTNSNGAYTISGVLANIGDVVTVEVVTPTAQTSFTVGIPRGTADDDTIQAPDLY